MARDKQSEEKAGDIPAWFMTYSDVITLLMTFFILLLTFSTTEPERFEKIQVAMFGGAGSTGFAGDPPDSLELDTFASRIRPPSARMCLEGSEMPPIHIDPDQSSAGESLNGLEPDENIDLAHEFAVEIDLRSFVGNDGQIHAIGKQYAKMFAAKLYQLPIHMTFEVTSTDELNRAAHFAHHIFREYKIKPGQMGIRLVADRPGERALVVIEHFLGNDSRIER